MLDTLTTRYLAGLFPEVGPREFYRDLFPEGELECRGEYVDGKYCGIAVQVTDAGKAKRYSVTDDLDVIGDLCASDDFCVMSPVSFAGKSQKQENARFLHAVVFDVDGLVERPGEAVGLKDLFHQMTLDNAYALPRPTYVVASGTGIHLYYMLERPVPMFRNVIKQLSALRHNLAGKIWNEFVTRFYENVQYESVTQGFRMVGTVTKNGADRVRAFLTGEKVTIEYLNGFVTDRAARVTTFAYKSDLTLDEARKRYPEWYERRIVGGRAPGTWTCKRDLYDWWKRKIEEGAVPGHRYFCLMALAIYAQKCAIGYDELLGDAMAFVPKLDSRSNDEGNRFTRDDAVKALEAYNASYQTFPRRAIQELSGIEVPANKRNGRKQSQHLKLARFARDLNYSDGDKWSDGGGRRPKVDLVREFASEHQGMNHSEIARALGVSRPTVIKWLKGVTFRPGYPGAWEADGMIYFSVPASMVQIYDPNDDEPCNTESNAGAIPVQHRVEAEGDDASKNL